MNSMLDLLLEQGSYALMFLALLAAGLGVPMPEDIVLLAGGALVSEGVTSLTPTLAVCIVGVMAGDLTIFLMARTFGAKLLEHRFYAKLLPERRRNKLERNLRKHGSKIIFVARFLPGLRAPIFALSGMHRMSLAVFVFWDGLALLLSAPLFIALGYFLADRLEDAVRGLTSVRHFLLLAIGVSAVAYVAYALLRRWLRKRRQSR